MRTLISRPAVASRRAPLILPAVLLGLALAVACGGSDDPEPDDNGGPGPSRDNAAGENAGGESSSSEAGSGGNGTEAGSAGSEAGGGVGQGGDSGVGGESSGGAGSVVPVEPGAKAENEVGANGGEIVVKNADGETTTTLVVPRGAVTESTPVTIEPAELSESTPASVEAVGAGLTIDFGGTTLKVPAKAKLRVAFNPEDGDLVILVVTDSGTGLVKYTLETQGGASYAVFDVIEGGRYLPVRLKKESGCEETRPTSVAASTQAAIDELAKVRRIVGDLRISGSAVTSLKSLKCLVQLDGALIISGTNLENLQGLEQLTFVGVNSQYTSGYYGVQLTQNALLDSASLPSVLAIGTRQTNYYYQSVFQVLSNAVLASFAADAIESAGLIFQNNGAAATSTSISLAALRKAQALSIAQNPSLEDLDGLGALDTVIGDVSITNNGLKNLDGLKSLRKTGNLTVQNNAALTSATGFSKLARAGSINFSGNALLKSLNFGELEHVAPSLLGAAATSISISGNSSLLAFSVPKLKALDGAFFFSQNGSATVKTVLDLAALESVTGAVSFTQNLGAESLDGLNALTTAGSITLTGNASIKDTDGLASLQSVEDLSIGQNTKLGSVKLEKLEQISGALTIGNNAELATIELPAVATVDGNIAVQSNAALTSFSMDALRVAPAYVSFSQNGSEGASTTLSLAALSSVAQALSISSNNGLTALDGFGSLLSVGGDLTILSNAALTNVNLTKLATVSGAIRVTSNAKLENLAGFSALSRITRELQINSNAALTSIALPALTTAGGIQISSNAALGSVSMAALSASTGALSIVSNGAASTSSTTLSFPELTSAQGFTLQQNPKLESLSGFPKLSGITGSFYVYNNVLLPNCVIVALRNQIQQAGAITGTITISANLVDGCETTAN